MAMIRGYPLTCANRPRMDPSLVVRKLGQQVAELLEGQIVGEGGHVEGTFSESTHAGTRSLSNSENLLSHPVDGCSA